MVNLTRIIESSHKLSPVSLLARLYTWNDNEDLNKFELPFYLLVNYVPCEAAL